MQSEESSEHPGWDLTHSPRPLQTPPIKGPTRPGQAFRNPGAKVMKVAEGEGDADREADVNGDNGSVQ